MNKDKVNEWVNSNSPEYFKDFMQELVSDMERRAEEHSKVVNAHREAVKAGRQGIGVRSEPGKGDDVYLIVIGHPFDFGADVDDFPSGILCGTPVIREDYAQCDFPIILKIKPGTRNRYVVDALRDYANRIESSEHDEFPQEGVS